MIASHLSPNHTHMCLSLRINIVDDLTHPSCFAYECVTGIQGTAPWWEGKGSVALPPEAGDYGSFKAQFQDI